MAGTLQRSAAHPNGATTPSTSSLMSLQTTDVPVGHDLQSANEPAAGIHPGWVILGVAATVVFMSAPGQSYSVAAFIDPMLTELRWTRTQYSVAYLVATLLGGRTDRARDRLERLPLAILATVLALIIAQPIGSAAQRHITTSSEIGELRIGEVQQLRSGRTTVHRVRTQG